MVVNFRARGISRGTHKLARTSMLNKKKNTGKVFNYLYAAKKNNAENQLVMSFFRYASAMC
jgi:hypothetical protein